MDRLLDGQELETEHSFENALRPTRFEDFPGQDSVKEKLKVFVQAAKGRGEALDRRPRRRRPSIRAILPRPRPL